MNIESAAFELDQAHCHLRDLLIHMTDEQVVDDYALSIGFGHVLCHFNMAWHKFVEFHNKVKPGKPVSWDTHSQTIPKFHDGFRLLPGLYARASPATLPQINLCKDMLYKVLTANASLIRILGSHTTALNQETCRGYFSSLIEVLNMAWHALREDRDHLWGYRKLIPNYFFEMRIE